MPVLDEDGAPGPGPGVVEASYSRPFLAHASIAPSAGLAAWTDAGVHAIGKKVVEEAAEVWMAAEYQSKAEAAEEISQLLYHLQVMMIALDLGLEDVYAHL